MPVFPRNGWVGADLGWRPRRWYSWRRFPADQEGSVAVLSLYQELRALVTALNVQGAEYALCGGVALAVHGEPRATRDIDVLVRPEGLDAVRLVLRALGYRLEAAPMQFRSGLEVHRISKVVEGELFTVDAVLATGPLEPIWSGRQVVTWAGQPLWVVSREGLVQMKRLAGRTQDLADIERLLGETDDQEK